MLVNIALATVTAKLPNPSDFLSPVEVFFSLTLSPISSRWGEGQGVLSTCLCGFQDHPGIDIQWALIFMGR